MIYLDNAATTKPTLAAIKAFEKSLGLFGNPSSLHLAGLDAKREITKAREVLAKIIGAKPQEIFFTSGGGEANNMAILGAAKKHKGSRMISTKAEHSSVLAPLEKLAKTPNSPFEFYFLALDDGRHVVLSDLENALTTKTCLVSVHHINNETGAIQDIEAIGKTIKNLSPATVFHVDAVQSLCKIPIDVNKMGIDLLSVSAHKLGGLKGCGALYIRSGINITPMILGGGQELGLRSGTENVPGIMAFAAAATDFWQKSAASFAHVSGLKERFIATLNKSGIDGIKINGQNTSPYIINVSIDGINPQVLLNALSAEGIYVSAGAACSSNNKKKREAQTALRISFGEENTLNEINKAAEAFIKHINLLCGTGVKRA